MLILTACGSDDSGGSGYGSLLYQGQTYKTVVIGNQTWMAENLNYNVTGSKCYGEDGVVFNYDAANVVHFVLTNAEIQANCDKYGRLYDWATAMALDTSCNSTTCTSLISEKHQGICPSGWHIPNEDEWRELEDYIENDKGCSGCADKHLKATSGWDYGNGLDTYGFSALPGGLSYNGNFSYAGTSASFWSATECDGCGAIGWELYYSVYNDDEGMTGFNDYKSNMCSVRCVRD